MDTKKYEALIDLISRMKQKEICGVLVFKPEVQEEDGDWPDMVVASTGDPKVISALLGNLQEQEQEQV